MSDLVSAAEEILRLQKRLERERQARLEADLITERATRELYDKQQVLELLRAIAVTANEAHSVEEAMKTALWQICGYMRWPLGHVFFCMHDGSLVSSGIWHLVEPERFDLFRQTTEARRYEKGDGLPGRAQEAGHLVWVADSSQATTYPRAASAQACGIQGAFAFPVMVGEEVAAVMEFFSTEPLRPEDSFLEAIEDIGSQLGRVIERQRWTESLQRQQKAEAAKSEFLANISHELRTPMNAILGMTELLFETPLSEEQKNYLEIAHNSAEGLLGLINDILDFSSSQSGRLVLMPREFRLRDLLGDLLSSLAARAHAKGLELIYHVASDVPNTLVGDTGRLRQILVNLVGNAIKFTDSGDIALRVEVERLGSSGTFATACLRFSLTDTGIGIPAEQCQAIFDAFSQVDGSSTRQYGGTGLGLSITRSLVELMEGRIWVESALGKGSTFHFTAEFMLDMHKQNLIQPQADAIDYASLCEVPILVVDDNALSRQLLGEYLAEAGMLPLLVESGLAALIELRRSHSTGDPFPFVLIDWAMPGMNGAMLAEQIRQDAVLAETCIIGLTSSSQMDTVALGQSLDIQSWVTKPVKQVTLLEAVARELSRHPYHKPAPKLINAALASTWPRHFKVLVAEDNVVNQRLIVRLLEKQGHYVTVAENGQEALTKFSQNSFDVVLMDIQMPVLNGVETAAAIREREKRTGTHVPIIAVTTNAMPGDRESYLAAGMDGYVAKPIRIQTLLNTIDELVHSSRNVPL